MGSINGLNFQRIGIRARDAKGNLRPISQIGNELFHRMYGNRKVTVENAMQVFNPNSKAYQDVMLVAGGDQNLFNLLANNVVYQAKNKGKALTNMKNAKSVMDKTLGLPSDDPTRAAFNLNQSEAKVLGVTGKGQVQGYSAAMNLTAAVNDGFAKLGEVLPAVVDNLGRLKGFLDTLPQAGAGGATISGGLGKAVDHGLGLGETALELAGIKSASKFVRGAGGRAAAATAAEGGIGAGEVALGGGAVLSMRKKLSSGARSIGRKLMGGGGKRVAMAGETAEAASAAEAAALAEGATAAEAAAAGEAAVAGTGILAGLGSTAAGIASTIAAPLAIAAVGAWEFSVLSRDVTKEQAKQNARGRWLRSTDRAKHYPDPRKKQEKGTGGDTGSPGPALSKADLTSVLKQAGFSGKALNIAYAVSRAESGGKPHNHNPNASTGDNSYGLFQINMIGKNGPTRRKKFHLKSNEDLYNPLTNAKIAYHMSNHGKNWSAWTTYTSGKYKHLMIDVAGDKSANHKSNDKNASDLPDKSKLAGMHAATNAAGKTVAPSDKGISADYGQKPKNNTYWQWKHYHTGRDYKDPAGTPVKAFQDGIVKYVGEGKHNKVVGEPYGNVVIVDHGGYQSMYAHLNRGTVKVGQKVRAGQQIAISGQTGSGAKFGAHLHFEIRKGKYPNANETDPRPYLGGKTGGVSKGILDSIGSAISTGIGDVAHGIGAAVTGVEKGISGAVTGVEKAIRSGWHVAWGALTGNTSGSSGGGGFGGGVSPTGNSEDSPLSSMIGGDMGPPPMSSGGNFSGSGGNIVHMTVHVHGSSVHDARRFAKEVQSVLSSEDRTVRLGKY
jgi:murein DD-endopeptidase MepM/ murein hydrolase activator NlpD